MKVLVAGDYCPQKRVSALFDNNEFHFVLGGVKGFTDNVDYSIVNFECVVSDGTERPIDKIGPNLKCTEKGIEALSWAGFDCVTLANNHFYDYGDEGVINTIKTCDKNNLDYVGGGINIEDASRTLFKKIGEHVLAIINCCEHEFSIATDNNGGSNPLNPIRQHYAIREAREHADFVLVIVHGGNEHYQLPSPRMKETYQFFIDSGADAVINHHQHCYSGYEYYKGKPIFYGLGNFCFDNDCYRSASWNEGFLLSINLTSESIDFEMFPYYQCGKTSDVYMMNAEKSVLFKRKIMELNTIIGDDIELKSRYDSFIDGSYSEIREVFEPYNNRLMIALYRRRLLPSLINSKKKRMFLAFLQCESQLPKIYWFLKKQK